MKKTNSNSPKLFEVFVFTRKRSSTISRVCCCCNFFFDEIINDFHDFSESVFMQKKVIFSGGDSSKKYGADHQRLQISDLHFDKFPTPATFACWKIRFKIEVCSCSQFPTESMQWINEVEMVDSVDELRSSSSTRGISNARF